MPRSSYRDVFEFWSGDAGVIGVNRMPDPAAGAAVFVDEDMSVVDVIEKPPHGTAGTDLNHSGLGILPAVAWSHLERVSPSPRGELELTSALGSMLAEGVRITAVEIGPVIDVGTPERLRDADRLARVWG
jgi:dTDP-glucose pyrophosphorylase